MIVELSLGGKNQRKTVVYYFVQN